MMLFSCVLTTSCIRHTIYHHYESVSLLHGWRSTDTLNYNIQLKDSMKPINLSLEIRHTDRYPYQDLWLQVTHNLTDSTVWEKDTLHLTLCNAKGNWNGTGGATNLYVYNQPIETLIPQNSGKRELRISSLMSDSVLNNISDIGIRISHP